MISISNSAFVCFFVLLTDVFCDGEQNRSDQLHFAPSSLPVINYIPQINITQCKGHTICNEVSNYPESLVLDAFKKNTTRYDHYLGEDRVDSGIVNRFMGLESTLCGSVAQLEEPKAGRNKNDEWMFIVNHGEYKQAVEIRICTNENKTCNFDDGFPFRTECRQKYIYRKMLALDPKDGQLKEDTFKLPSCCSCRYFEKKNN